MPTLPKSNRPHWAGKRKPFDGGRRGARWPGYNTERWRGFRRVFRLKYERCSEPGCEEPTYYCDHTVPVLEWIKQGGDPFDESNIKPKCFRHGNVKTGHEGQAKIREYKRRNQGGFNP